MRTVGSMGSLSISAPLSANFGYLPEDFYPPGIRERFVALLERVKVFKFLFSCWRRPAMVIFMLKQLAARVFAREGLEEFTFWYGRLQKSLHAETGEAPCSSTYSFPKQEEHHIASSLRNANGGKVPSGHM